MFGTKCNVTLQQQQSVTPASYASTTQVRSENLLPPTLNQMVPQVPVTQVPLLQNLSVASTANIAAS